MESQTKPTYTPVAFAWINDQLFLGYSHPEIMSRITGDDETHWTEAFNWADQHNQIFGYIYPKNYSGGISTSDPTSGVKADIFSDFFDEKYNQEDLEACLAALKRYWPELTEVTYGPDEHTLKDMSDFFDTADDPREAALRHIARQTGKSMI